MARFKTSPVMPSTGRGGLMPGLMGRLGGRQGVGDMLLGGGMGLLSQGPSMTPQGPMAGLGQGMMMGRQMSQQRMSNEREQQRMELEMQKFQQAQAQMEAQRAAIAGAGGGALGQAFPDKFAAAQMRTPANPLAAFEAFQALAPEQQAAFLQYEKDTGGAGVNVNVGDRGGFRPSTDIGKTAQDLAHWQDQPEGPMKARMVNALSAKIAKQNQPTAEQGEKQMKYATTLDAANRFMTLATENEGSVGPFEGRGTKLRGGFGFGSEVEGEMRALEATMKSRLGTALSGAAIPEKEWPTYEAQLPTMTDSPEMRTGKMKALDDTLTFLANRQAELMGQMPAETGAQTTPMPASSAIQWSELPGS